MGAVSKVGLIRQAEATVCVSVIELVVACPNPTQFDSSCAMRAKAAAKSFQILGIHLVQGIPSINIGF